MSTRKRYTKEFKSEAVRLSLTSGKTIGQQAADLGISEAQLHAWRRSAREHGSKAFPGNGIAREAELAEWKRRALRAEMEREIQKKDCAALRAEYGVQQALMYGFIETQSAGYPVEVVCGALAVNPSGYYAWRVRPESERAQSNEALRERIDAAWIASRKTYGSPRMTAQLQEEGVPCSENRMARVMAESDLKARKTNAFTAQTTDSNHCLPIAPNHLDQDFSATAPNQKWVGDITYIPTQQGWLYLAVWMDLFSRMIVGWSMGSRCDARLVVNALEMAQANRGAAPGLLTHLDRGSQYASAEHREVLLPGAFSKA